MTRSTPRSGARVCGGASATRCWSGRLRALLATVLFFVGGALGLAAYKVDYSTTNFFKQSVDSVEGFEVLGRSFPKGTLAPITVLVERSDGPVTRRDVSEAVVRLERVNGVARATPTGLRSTQRRDRLHRRDPRERPLRGVDARRRAADPRQRRRPRPWIERSGRRRQRDPVRLRPDYPGRPEADRADHAAGDRDHPRGAAEGADCPAGADRQRDPLASSARSACRSCSSGSWSGTPVSTPRSRLSRSSSWSRSASTTRSS